MALYTTGWIAQIDFNPQMLASCPQKSLSVRNFTLI